MGTARNADELFSEMDLLHARASAAQRGLFALIAEVDRRELWADTGARDMAQWLGIRYGISDWKARKWIAASHALADLPVAAAAFEAGELGIDKVVELTRFATAATEPSLVEWARNVPPGRVRQRAELAERRTADEAAEAHRDRTLSWHYFDEGLRFWLQAELPAADGAIVARALERLADTLPQMPGEEGPMYADARRADALVALASTRISQDADPDRATVVVHARVDGGEGGLEIENGPGLPPETVERLLCQARVQAVVEDSCGRVIGLGRTTREPSEWMLRQIRYRDRGCTFPGCGARRFVHAHHIEWWSKGGRTDLENLTMACSFHHKLVHEHGWTLHRHRQGVRWYRPDGTRFRAGPSPPDRRGRRPAAKSFLPEQWRGLNLTSPHWLDPLWPDSTDVPVPNRPARLNRRVDGPPAPPGPPVGHAPPGPPGVPGGPGP